MLAAWESLKNEGIDPYALWEMVGEDMELLRELVQIFTAAYPGMLRSIEDALNEGDAAALRRASHKLKGALLQLAASEAAATAEELEHSAGTMRREELARLVTKLRTDLPSLLVLLETMLSVSHATSEAARAKAN